MSTAVTVPQGLELPAHLRTPEAVAQIAAANAAAAGGIKTGGFPKVSIEGGKFHEIDSSIDGGNPRTYMVAGQPGQPPLPMMCLEAVVIAANPALVKTFYAKKWQKGDDSSPDCQSSNGITPDATVVNKQSPVCATCPQNQWGSKISEASGKDVKACSDSKQMAILPSADLTYKALGLAVTPAALGDWGKYVKALSERNIPVNAVVTNITFDHTASFPKLQFAYNRFLTPEEFERVKKRIDGDDVKAIISSTRSLVPALAAPAATAALPASLAAPAPVAPPAPSTPPLPPQPAPAPAATGFGATKPVMPQAVPAAVAPVAPPAPGRTRRTRAQIEADEAAANGGVDLSYLPLAIKVAVEACGVTSDAGKAMLAQFPKPAAAIAPVPPQPAPAPAATGFSASPVASIPPAPPAAAAGATAAGNSLKSILEAKLGIGKPPAAG